MKLVSCQLIPVRSFRLICTVSYLNLLPIVTELKHCLHVLAWLPKHWSEWLLGMLKSVEVEVVSCTKVSAQTDGRMQRGRFDFLKEQNISFLSSRVQTVPSPESWQIIQVIRLRKSYWNLSAETSTWDLCGSQGYSKYTDLFILSAFFSFLMRQRGNLKGDVYEMVFGHCCL